jgi:hypothetical protein
MFGRQEKHMDGHVEALKARDRLFQDAGKIEQHQWPSSTQCGDVNKILDSHAALVNAEFEIR